MVLGSAVAVSLVGGGLMASPAAAQDECGVAIYGGVVLNETVIDLNANGGTAISDASGGLYNAPPYPVGEQGGGVGMGLFATALARAGVGAAAAGSDGGAASGGT